MKGMKGKVEKCVQYIKSDKIRFKTVLKESGLEEATANIAGHLQATTL